MRRITTVCSIAAVLLFAAFAAGHLTGAQEATPATDGSAGLEGIAFEIVGAGNVSQLPATPAEFLLIRITLAPGASIPSEAGDPTLSLVAVESGAVTIDVDVALEILRGSALEAAAGAPADVETAAAGEVVTLEAGDSLVSPPNTAGELRNDGVQPAVILLANISPE